MKQLTLYLMLGYPGAGKTTASKLIAGLTGAEHLWADHERRAMFKQPTHSRAESGQLYAHLNDVTERLLGEGKSVVFDTNFNFYKDRQHLRRIAHKHGAATVLVWVTTPKEVAKQRAVHDRTLRNNYEFVLPEGDFERMSNHLQAPQPDERPLLIDGTNITPAAIEQALASRNLL